MKSLLKKIVYRLKYPEVTLCSGVSIGGHCEFGKHTYIYAGTRISNCKLGICSYIGGHSSIHNVVIGNYCSIAEGVQIGLGKHPIHLVSTYPGFYSKKASATLFFGNEYPFSEYDNVTIGSDVWIGFRAIIRDGVKVGSGAIIAAGAIVTHDVEPYTIVCGVPARPIKKRFSQENIIELLKIKWWDWPLEKIRTCSPYFLDVERFIKLHASNQ